MESGAAAAARRSEEQTCNKPSTVLKVTVGKMDDSLKMAPVRLIGARRVRGDQLNLDDDLLFFLHCHCNNIEHVNFVKG